MLYVEAYVSLVQLESLRSEWNALQGASGTTSPFASYDWFACCIAGYGRDKQLLVLVVRDGGAVIGIAPLWRCRETVRGIAVRKVEWIGCPDTPWVDVITLSQRRTEVIGAVAQYLFSIERRGWDLLVLSQWPADAPACLDFQALLRTRGKRFLLEQGTLCPYVSVAGTWEEFLQTRTQRFRKTRRNIANRIGKMLNVKLICYQSNANGQLMRDIVAVSQKSWKHDAGIAISSNDEALRFFTAFTQAGSRAGWLWVWILTVADVPVAMEYDLLHDGTVSALRADFDESYSSSSPGAYLESHIVQQVFESGYREYSSGPGLNAYKLHWTERMRENVVVRVFNGTLRGCALWQLEHRLLPLARRLRRVPKHETPARLGKER